MTDAVGTSRILTLLFTDLADSTALKTQRGDQAVGGLITRHRAHVRRLAADLGGRIIDWAGDGCFLTFETPSAAVLFALRLQQVHRDEPDLPGVRTGIHMGEVSEHCGPDGDAGHPRVEGLAVDLAARISSLAKPGQILMSSAVADSARQRLDAGAFSQPVLWRAHGSYALKGFDEALHIREVGIQGVAPFEAPAAGEKAQPAPSTAAQAPRRRSVPLTIAVGVLGAVVAYVVLLRAPDRLRVNLMSPAATAPTGNVLTAPGFGDRPAIAVLPLDNLSPDPEQAFFADGLAEDLITRLSAWRSFPVIARNSSFKYRGGNLDLKKVSAELGARYLVEGSVRRSGDRIRVSAQLIDAPSGEHIWAETYDRDVKDIFSVQDEISSTIAATIAEDLGRVEGERARQRGTANLEAWSVYELGCAKGYGSRDDVAEARRLFERAIALDTGFATALAKLSYTYSWDVAFGWTDAPDQSAAAAIEAARRAIVLDPREPLAHAALANAYLAAGDVQAGFDSAQRAIDLNPSMPEAWIELGWAQLLLGHSEASITANRNVQRLNPKGDTAIVAWDNMALAHWEMGEFDASVDAARHLVAMKPDYWWGYVELALSFASLGKLDEARAAIGQARRVQPDLSIAKIQRAFGVSRPEIDARRDAALRKAGLE